MDQTLHDANGRRDRRRRHRRWRIIGWICLWALFAMTAVIAGKVSAAEPSGPLGTRPTAILSPQA
ncbi:hypothetical protein FKV24_007860 [Lysobacter maris]|uniref:Uncharacterized protein n=1 Tax=Marilutibacter maris TaxID=1605891 RepID=A0A508AUD5_9GAMM|nr:hypothetical protein [Lysobacter maris]KAB8191383.1 hypothetical protein FKV24_007860 [Lysobacter maris]